MTNRREGDASEGRAAREISVTRADNPAGGREDEFRKATQAGQRDDMADRA